MEEAPKKQTSRLWAWLREELPTDSKLPWCRTIDAYTFRDIAKSRVCGPVHCKFFKEELVYLFYGRPAFRAAEKDLANGNVAPVVLIFGADLDKRGARMFPFDSGAFKQKRYEPSMHPRMKLGDFELGCEENAPAKHVAAFFGSNRSYLKTRPVVPARNYAGEFEVAALVHLFSGRGKNKDTDDRRLTMELQLRDGIDLNERSLLAVIYPDEIEGAKWFGEFAAKQQGLMLLPYEVHEDKIAKDYQALLEDRSADVLRAKRLL